jgi:hypothetical protein
MIRVWRPACSAQPAPDNLEGHPFHPRNNINPIAISSIVDHQVLPLDPRVQAFQEAYLRKVVDTVHDLANVCMRSRTNPRGRTPSRCSFLACRRCRGQWVIPPGGSTR